MEAEIIAIDHSCCKIFPIMDGVKMGKTIGRCVDNATIQVLTHENNARALVLAETIMPQFTCSSQH